MLPVSLIILLQKAYEMARNDPQRVLSMNSMGFCVEIVNKMPKSVKANVHDFFSL